MRIRLSILPALLLLSSGLLACGGDDEETPAPEPTRSAQSCSVPESFSPRACVRDDQCACGSYCDLGECTVDCESSNDCESGQSCNDFGRCVVAGSNVVPLSTVENEGTLVLNRHYFQRTPTGRYVFTVTAQGGPVSRARIRATEGLEVAQTESGVDFDELSYAENIVVQALGDGQSVSFVARDRQGVSTALTIQPANARVEIIGSEGTRTQATIGDTALEDFGEDVAALAGEYEGSVRVASRGVNRFLTGPAVNTRTGGRLNARVFAASNGVAVIALEDPNTLLHPDGVWVGELDVSAGEVRFPAY
ncbi:MAG: hypothetical protein AAFY60_00565, partial [Myxococcota bacterium]